MGIGIRSAHIDETGAQTSGSRTTLLFAIVAIFVIPAIDAWGAGPIILGLILTLHLLTTKGNPERTSGRAFKFAASLFALSIVAGTIAGTSNGSFRYDIWLLGAIPLLTYLVGRRLTSSIARTFALRSIVVIATLAASLAIYEYATETYVLNNATFFDTPLRGGRLRARSIYPQSLVLAFVSVVVVPLASSRQVIHNLATRTLIVGVLLGGALASGSRSAIPILILASVICAAFTVTDRFQRGLLATTGLVLAAMLYWPEVTSFFSRTTTYVTSNNPDTASAQFRAELYRNLPQLLTDRPFGTGIGAIPEGYIEFETSFGTVDARRTVDSEYVLAAIKFGLLGLGVWIALAVNHVQHLRVRVTSVGIALTVCLIFGFFLALQAWLTIVALIALLLGLQSSDYKEAQAAKKSASKPTDIQAK